MVCFLVPDCVGFPRIILWVFPTTSNEFSFLVFEDHIDPFGLFELTWFAELDLVEGDSGLDTELTISARGRRQGRTQTVLVPDFDIRERHLCVSVDHSSENPTVGDDQEIASL